jgi:hypothetical protein
MTRFSRWFMLAFLFVCTMLALSACGSASPSPTAALEFGPVYPLERLTDPLVANTVLGDALDLDHMRSRSKTSSSPAVSAEIRGYLVDWVIVKLNTATRRESTMMEFVVMKDGTLYRFSSYMYMRPSAAFGQVPPPRLGPEPAAEAKVRIAAVAAAQAAVAKLHPRFAKVTPVVYNYLVRIHRADGSSTDVWVDPDVGYGRFFYGLGLTRVTK